MSGFGTEEKAGGATASSAVNPVNHSGRLLATKIVLLLAFVVAALRLVQIQIVDSGKYQAIARKQYRSKNSSAVNPGKYL